MLIIIKDEVIEPVSFDMVGAAVTHPTERRHTRMNTYNT